jgi:UDP-N-acetylglucosamine--N-acetylmuramyl-(pentapeptide) pyrophosphoryl-undecaprenol N-acetylglucosamine transferase
MPGLALAENLRSRLGPQCRVLFVGTDRPLERSLLAARGHRHVPLPVESSQTLRRQPWKFAVSNWRAYRQSHDLISQERPKVVVGLGGFASVPVVWAATRRKVPTVLLEQNVVPGRANRLLGRRANAVCLAFDESRSWLRGCRQVVTTGTPVAAAIASLALREPRAPSPESPTLLVLGGSQGAAGLNHAVMHIAPELQKRWPQVLVVHQTGAEQYDAVKQAYAHSGLAHVVEPFFDDLSNWYGRATLAISRAGGTTLAELACAGCPAVLVPFPSAADDHQTRNAEWFAGRGAARIVRQVQELGKTAGGLLGCVEQLLGDGVAWATMQRKMRELANPAATERVVQVLERVTSGAEN